MRLDSGGGARGLRGVASAASGQDGDGSDGGPHPAFERTRTAPDLLGSAAMNWSALADQALAGAVLSRDAARAVLHATEDELLCSWTRPSGPPRLLGPARLAARARQREAGRVPGGLRVLLAVEQARIAGRRSPDEVGRRPGRWSATRARGPGQALLHGDRDARPIAAGPRTICTAAERIKAELDIELCASLGILTEAKAQRLAASGVDRFNHNLETSERHYEKIVSTHTWRDRVETVRVAKAAGMDTCCGGIVGLGESEDDLLDLAFALRDLDVDSVPVNFLDARPGTPLAGYPLVEPGYALRALCMFRFVHPRTDLRVAGGREITLRALQAFALYPANSIFTQGYLTTGGATPQADHQMIRMPASSSSSRRASRTRGSRGGRAPAPAVAAASPQLGRGGAPTRVRGRPSSARPRRRRRAGPRASNAFRIASRARARPR